MYNCLKFHNIISALFCGNHSLQKYTLGNELNLEKTHCLSSCRPCFQVNWLFCGMLDTSGSLVFSETKIIHIHMCESMCVCVCAITLVWECTNLIQSLAFWLHFDWVLCHILIYGISLWKKILVSLEIWFNTHAYSSMQSLQFTEECKYKKLSHILKRWKQQIT